MSDTGGPAFPTIHADKFMDHHGMTLRDYFMAAVAQGLLSGIREQGIVDADKFAVSCRVLADAMIAERSK